MLDRPKKDQATINSACLLTFTRVSLLDSSYIRPKTYLLIKQLRVMDVANTLDTCKYMQMFCMQGCRGGGHMWHLSPLPLEMNQAYNVTVTAWIDSAFMPPAPPHPSSLEFWSWYLLWTCHFAPKPRARGYHSSTSAVASH